MLVLVKMHFMFLLLISPLENLCNIICDFYLPAMQEAQVRSLGWKDPLEKEMATHSNILAQEIPGSEEPGGLQSMGLQELDTTQRLNHHHHIYIQCLAHSRYKINLSSLPLTHLKKEHCYVSCQLLLSSSAQIGARLMVTMCSPRCCNWG